MLVQAVSDGGGVQYDLTASSTDPESATERTKRSSTSSPSPMSLSYRKKAREEEEEESGGRRGMKRPLAPSPRTVMSKKRRTK
jgi:hypothetical protein